MTEQYLSELNEAQRAAVEYLAGPELVIAGAGSGKTRVLTYKIVHLLHCGYNPYHILALTFTNKAAREMQERIIGLTGPEVAGKLWMGTFHSVFARILRRHADRLGFPSNFTIYDVSDTKSLLKSIIKDLKLDPEIYRPGTIAGDISNAKNHLMSPEDYAADPYLMQADKDAKRPETATIYRIYRDRCRVSGAMDFDDLLFYTNVLVRDNPDLRQGYRDFFDYILVDEYQDTNFAQHAIVRQLTGDKGALTVVGDDAQSIYSFRGANIRNILDLSKSFPALKTFKLEQNYRSTKNIINAANSLIAKNVEQIPKEVFSENAAGEKVEIVQCFNDYEEGYIIANAIMRRRMRSHGSYSQCAILYRTNAQSRVIEEALRNRNIPYRIFGGLAFYQRKEIKDAVCYFRLAVNPADDEALKRVINTPKRSIGDTTVAKVVEASIAAGKSMWEIISDPALPGVDVNKGTAKKLHDFAALIQEFIDANSSGMDPEALSKLIIERTGLLRQYLGSQTPENISKRDNLMELLNAVSDNAAQRKAERPEEPYTMGEFLAEVSLLTDQDTAKEDEDAVTLMTIHAAKGLEFDNIFIAGVEEELLPSGMALHSANAAQEVEEERRLMYVAITRAMSYCMASFTRKRRINGKDVVPRPSRFLSEIDRRYIRLMTGSSLDSTPMQAARTPFAPARTVEPLPKPAERPVFNRPFIASRPAAPAPGTSSEFTVHDVSELKEGLRMEHPRFGAGTIEKIDTAGADTKIMVRFSDNTLRTLLLKFAKFKIL